MAPITPATSQFHLTTAGTYILQATGGTALLSVNVNKGAASSSMTVYDNTAGSGTVISVVGTTTAVSLTFNTLLVNGCTVVITGGNPDVLLTFGEQATSQIVVLPLPVSQGGTGSATTSYVDLTTAQTVAGSKTFTGTNTAAAGNLTIGTTGSLGDNGVGVIQLANATTVPTTNPVSGAIIYASGGGVFHRDPSGQVSAITQGNRVGAPMPLSLAETANRNTVAISIAPASGTLYIYSVWLVAGESVGHIGFCSGTTAATNPTHWWVALLDNTYKQQAHSADQLTGAIAASTWQNLAMVTPFVATYTGLYYLSLMVATSTTQPTVLANSGVFATQFLTGTGVPTPLLGGLSTTALTVPGTDGTTVYAAPTTNSQTIYMYATA